MTDLEPPGISPVANPRELARPSVVDERSDADLLRMTPVDPGAFGEFYLRHADRLYGYLRPRCAGTQDAYDLVSETFAQALHSIHGFDPERGEAAAWLFGIAKNKHRHYTRRGAVETRARLKMEMAVVPLDADMVERLDETIDLTTVRSLLEPAIQSLPESLRAVVRRRCLDGATYDEIAHDLDIRPAAARKRVSRGLRQLEQYLGNNPFESHD